MNPLALYIGKVVLCSGVLFGYYYLALRNKTFYQWNRFYLLACVALSLTVPLLQIEIANYITPEPNKVLKILHVVTAGTETEVAIHPNQTSAFTLEQYTILGYSLISAILLCIILINSSRIYHILRSYPKQKIGNVCFLNTDAKGTPFSFFHYIVWNHNIDLSSESGQRIFQHELTHVQQRHTWDKVFLLLILIPYWINPFFWLIRRELTALHEFAADQKAMQSEDVAALAQLILNTTFPKQHFLFTNHLFQSTIKRRLAMFTKLQNPQVNYASRIAVLPLLVLVLAAFALKTSPLAKRHATAFVKPFMVVIDAGHGGDESGAKYNNIFEKDIALALAKKIKEQNRNGNIEIILTRETDVKTGLKDRVQTAQEKKADLFLSIHVNAADDDQQTITQQNGMQVVVPSKNPPYQQQSEAAGSVLVQELSSAYTTQTDLIKSKTGVWVLDHNICPAVLLECGSLTDQKDRDFITQSKNQTLIATKILDAIARYAVLKNTNASSFTNDSVPNRVFNNKAVTDVQYFEWPKKEVHLFFADGTKDTISVAEAIDANLFDTSEISQIEHKPWAFEKVTEPNVTAGDFIIRKASLEEARNFKGIVVFNNKIFKGSFQQLPAKANEMAYISFVKGVGYAQELGIKMEPNDSLLDISTKAFIQANTRTDGDPANEPLFITTEIEPKFPDANGGWNEFLQKNLDVAVPVKKGAKPGTYKVSVGFIVENDGTVQAIQSLTHYGYGMEEEVVRLMKTSPNWKPAMQNGHTVSAYKKQTVTFVIAEG